MAVDIKRTEIFHTPGRFGWDGGFGTSAYTDPADGMIGILLTQRLVDSPEPPTLTPTSGHWRMERLRREQGTGYREQVIANGIEQKRFIICH
jgi:CubicO group peptidase (beta-lactamase class C family)